MKRGIVCLLLAMGLVVLSSRALAAPGEWEPKAPLPGRRCAFPSVVLDGKIYAVGGENALTQLDIYDPATDSWTPGEWLVGSVWYTSAAVLDGRIYVPWAGVQRKGVWERTSIVYDSRDQKWQEMEKMPLECWDLFVTAIGGKIFIVGKDSSANESTIRVTVYDPASDSYVVRDSKFKREAQYAAATVDSRIYLIGGGDKAGAAFANQMFATVSEYDPATDTWRERADAPMKMYWQTAAAWNGKIYVSGGFNDGKGNELWIYDVRADTWEAGPPMKMPRLLASSVAIEGKIYVLGGYSAAGYLADVEAYDTGIPTESLAVDPVGKLPCVWGQMKANER